MASVSEYYDQYWKSRSSHLYLHAVGSIVASLGVNARSIVDIGSARTPFITNFEWIQDRHSLDLRSPYKGPGITSHRCDFLIWEPPVFFDIVTCMQVIEHIPNVDGFCQKLLATGRIVVVSVPYKWKFDPKGSHINDPIDSEKMQRWFGRAPNFSVVIPEVLSATKRMINVYDTQTFGGEADRWRNCREPILFDEFTDL